MRFYLSVYDEGDDGLPGRARQVWTSFGETGMHPRGQRRPDLVGTTSHRVGDHAGVLVSNHSVNLVLATELLTKATELEQRLTLLHECIHMDFALGEHNERWLRLHRRAEESVAAIQAMMATTQQEADRQGYFLRRNAAAFLFLRLPDEIVAEQCLSRTFEEWFEERVKYYVRMRQAREAEIAAPKSDVPLRPFHVFYELLRNALYVPLLADVPALEGQHTELRRLEKNADDRLRECGPPDLLEFLFGLKPRLLDVSFDEPLGEAEAAYEELYARITAIDPTAEQKAADRTLLASGAGGE